MKKIIYCLSFALLFFFSISFAEAANTYQKVLCGSDYIPYAIPQTVKIIYSILKIVTPIIIIVFGMIDFLKAVMAQKEDEIKKGQQTFVKRLIAAVVVFLVVFIVQIVFNLVANDNDGNIWGCVDCFINYSESNSNCVQR